MGAFCQHVEHLDLDLLIDQFTQLISDRQRYEQSIRDANLVFRERLERQDLQLAARFFQLKPVRGARAAGGRESISVERDHAIAQLRGRSILVTGASGYLGTAVIEQLLAIGSRVTGISRTRPSVELDHWEAVDLRDRDRVDDAFRQCKPELVFHLAGITNASRVLDHVVPSFDANAQGTVAVLEACKRYGCERFLDLRIDGGTSSTIRGTRRHLLTDPQNGSAPSSLSLFHTVFGLPTIILRPFFV